MIPPKFIYPSPDIPLRVLIIPLLCIGSSRENLLAFSLPNSEMHFTTLSVSASTLRTRSAVFSLATLFFIVFY